jgi:hypothetical protein
MFLNAIPKDLGFSCLRYLLFFIFLAISFASLGLCRELLLSLQERCSAVHLSVQCISPCSAALKSRADICNESLDAHLSKAELLLRFCFEFAAERYRKSLQNSRTSGENRKQQWATLELIM